MRAAISPLLFKILTSESKSKFLFLNNPNTIIGPKLSNFKIYSFNIYNISNSKIYLVQQL